MKMKLRSSYFYFVVFSVARTISLRISPYKLKRSPNLVHKSFLNDAIQSFDQFIQTALNTATSTPNLDTLTSLDLPLTTNVPELNILTIDEENGSLNPLGNDLLIFLCSTIGIVPLFKWLKASPVIGFLSAGVLMGPAFLGLFSDLNDMESIADFGVLFLLFEQGLELTVDRLKSLSKFAFGLGTLQVVLCTLAFFIFPFIGGVDFLERFFQSRAAVVDITRVDEALVIGAALSLSSSAFVLKILQEKGQLSTTFGAASLGVLLLQDIAVVPLLVLLPIIESNSGPMPLSVQLSLLGTTFLKAILGLGGILLIGGRAVRYLFSLVAQTRSSETFVALCLLVALGTGALTDALGLSSTLGAFTAGTLLAESNYRTQIETDIKPFRGLLLALFFITTGASVDPTIIKSEFGTVVALVAGLISFKTIIISAIGPIFGLSLANSVRAGFVLSGGGEFAFVVLTLADKLGVLPDELAKILVGVVVISMALTPYLSNMGDAAADFIEELQLKQDSLSVPKTIEFQESSEGHSTSSGAEVIVICGFGPVGQTVARLLSSPLLDKRRDGDSGHQPLEYIAFDLDPNRVAKGYKEGRRVLYGDGSQPLVLSTAGIESPRAFVVTYRDPEVVLKTVERLRVAFPLAPIYSRSLSTKEYVPLMEAGATNIIIDERETSLRIFEALLSDKSLDLGPSDASQISSVAHLLRTDIELEDLQLLEVAQFQKKGSASLLSTSRVVSRDDDSWQWGTFAVLDEVARNWKGFVGARSWEKDIDNKKTVQNTVSSMDKIKSAEDENLLPDINSEDLGVMICLLPEIDIGDSSVDPK